MPRHASEQQFPHDRLSMPADDDQVGIGLFLLLEDDAGRIAMLDGLVKPQGSVAQAPHQHFYLFLCLQPGMRAIAEVAPCREKAPTRGAYMKVLSARSDSAITRCY